MARAESTMLELSTQAPPFSLPDTVSGTSVGLDDARGQAGLLVAFICNHCPYVVHIRDTFAAVARELQTQGIGVVAISANDAAGYPADGPDKMAQEARTAGYSFPYLFDESQTVAQAYTAACTPDFFLFDRELKLVYRGQFDGSRPGNGETVTGQDLRRAADSLLAGTGPIQDQKPSVGCSIKWKSGNEPSYFG
jgi:peroxiredoxin